MMTEMSLLCELSLKFQLALYLIEQTQLNTLFSPCATDDTNRQLILSNSKVTLA